MTSIDNPKSPGKPGEAATDLELAPKKSAGDDIAFGELPLTLSAAWTMAKVYAQSDLVPKDYRDKPYNIMAAWDMGRRLGFSPLQCLQNIAVINGRPGVWGDGMLAICSASPRYQDHDEFFMVGGVERSVWEGLSEAELKADDTKGVCSFTVAGRSKPVVASFSVGQAKRARLLDKPGTPWQNYPERMLIWRARGFAARDAFPTELRGLKSIEELRDYPDIETTTVVSPPLPAAGKRRPRTAESFVEAATAVADSAATATEPPPPAAPTHEAAAEAALPDQPVVTLDGIPIAVQDHIGRIVDIKPSGVTTFVVLDTGFYAGTKDKGTISDALEAREMGAVVELETRCSDPAKYKPTLLAVKPRLDLMDGGTP